MIKDKVTGHSDTNQEHRIKADCKSAWITLTCFQCERCLICLHLFTYSSTTLTSYVTRSHDTLRWVHMDTVMHTDLKTSSRSSIDIYTWKCTRMFPSWFLVSSRMHCASAYLPTSGMKTANRSILLHRLDTPMARVNNSSEILLSAQCMLKRTSTLLTQLEKKECMTDHSSIFGINIFVCKQSNLNNLKKQHY